MVLTSLSLSRRLWRRRQYDDPRPAGRRCRFAHPRGRGRRYLRRTRHCGGVHAGAVGVNMGTRFLASITSAKSEDAVKVEVLNDIQPLPGTAGYGTVLRSLHTPFMDEWGTKREEARREGERLWTEIQARGQVGRRHETLLTAVQTSGGIKEILPVAEIIRQLIAEAETVLSRAPGLASR